MNGRFDFQKAAAGLEASRQFRLAGFQTTRTDLNNETCIFEGEAQALENTRLFVRNCLQEGFVPINFPPLLQPTTLPEIVCGMALPTEIEINQEDLCRWLTMYQFSGMPAKDMKKIWKKLPEKYFKGWKEIGAPSSFFHYATKDGKTDRFCWREKKEKTGETFLEILALSGDPGLKAICSFPPSFGILEDSSNIPGDKILGVSIRRPAGGLNIIVFRNGDIASF